MRTGSESPKHNENLEATQAYGYESEFRFTDCKNQVLSLTDSGTLDKSLHFTLPPFIFYL